MKVFGTIKKVVKPLVDVPTWMGTSTIKDNWRLIRSTYKDIFTPREVKNTETFAEAMARMNLTEADLKARLKEYTILLSVYLIFAIGIISYGVFLLIEGGFLGFIIAFSLGYFSLAQAFRSHFWIFQIKRRKLGCTFKEWFSGTFGVKQ